MNSEAQRLAEEAKWLVGEVIHEFYQGTLREHQLLSAIDRLASLQSADQARTLAFDNGFETGRLAALEEAAKVCAKESVVMATRDQSRGALHCANRIRALASTEQAERNEGEKR